MYIIKYTTQLVKTICAAGAGGAARGSLYVYNLPCILPDLRIIYVPRRGGEVKALKVQNAAGLVVPLLLPARAQKNTAIKKQR